MSVGNQDVIELRTARGRDYPSIRQYSIFIPNRPGELYRLIQLCENNRLRICALAIADAADCAVVRLVLSRPENAYEILDSAGYRFCEVDLLVVELPNRERPIVEICSRLLQAEINIHYCFPLLVRPYGRPAMAFYTDDHDTAVKLLDKSEFVVLTESDLEE